MNILVLCDRYPYPLENGQNLRIFHYVRRLAERHTFDLICYGQGAPPPEITPLFRRIRTFPRPITQPRAGLTRLYEAFRVDELLARSEPVAAHLAAEGNADWDLVWISGWDMVVNVPREFPTPILMDAVDDGVLEHLRELGRATSFTHFGRVLKRLLMNFRFERTYFHGKAACLFVSEVDARVFSRIAPGTPTFVVQNGVDVDYFKPGGTRTDSETIIFEGNMSFSPNEDAAGYLVRDILPRVRAEIPDAKVLLVGKDPSPTVIALNGPNVHVTGFVLDVRPYLDAATVFACPMRKGAGIKNKVLQAWAMGKPVVATSRATGGLLVRDGENIMVRDNASAFARAIVRLLRDPLQRAALSAAARKTAEDAYTWGRQSLALERVMRATVQRHTERIPSTTAEGRPAR